MAQFDPYSPSRRYYECTDCGERTTAEDHHAECPECGGRVRNLAVARE